MNLSKHDPETEMEMDMTPMIDVVFLLIIFFMIITDLSQKELEVLELPVAVEAVKDEPDPSVIRPILNIGWDGEVIVRAVPIYNTEENDYRKLEGYLANQARLMPKEMDETLKKPLPDNPILIRADQVTPFKHIQKVMELCGKPDIAIWKVEIAAAQPENK